MQHKILSINEDYKNKEAYTNFFSSGTNSDNRNKMKNFLSVAINAELTGRQRQCIKLYYLDGLKMKEIAKYLDIHPSTVSRHMRSAHQKLKGVSKYCD